VGDGESIFARACARPDEAKFVIEQVASFRTPLSQSVHPASDAVVNSSGRKPNATRPFTSRRYFMEVG